MSIWERIDQSQKTVSQAISSDLSEMVRCLGEPLASTGKSRRENGNKLRKTRIRAAVGDQTEQKTLLLNSQFDSAWSKLSGAINYAKFFYNLVVCTVRKIKKSFALLGSPRLHAGGGFPADSGTTATPETNSKYGILLSYFMSFKVPSVLFLYEQDACMFKNIARLWLNRTRRFHNQTRENLIQFSVTPNQ